MQISLGAFYKKKRENNLTDELREDEKRKYDGVLEPHKKIKKI